MTNNRFTNEQLEYFSAAAGEIINREDRTSYERAASKLIIRLVAELQERRQAAMLQGAEPVSQTYKLPEEKSTSLQLRNLIRKRHAEVD